MKQSMYLRVALILLSLLVYVVVQNEPTETAVSEPVATGSVVGTSQEQAVVTRVIDGDTLVVSLGGVEERVRVIGIDTPETVDPRREPACFGNAATARAKELLPVGTVVQLMSDPSQANRDRYDRLLRTVVLANGSDLGLQLIEGGFAYEYTYGSSPHQHQLLYRAAQVRAKLGEKGLWDPTICVVAPGLEPGTSSM